MERRRSFGLDPGSEHRPNFRRDSFLGREIVQNFAGTVFQQSLECRFLVMAHFDFFSFSFPGEEKAGMKEARMFSVQLPAPQPSPALAGSGSKLSHTHFSECGWMATKKHRRHKGIAGIEGVENKFHRTCRMSQGEWVKAIKRLVCASFVRLCGHFNCGA